MIQHVIDVGIGQSDMAVFVRMGLAMVVVAIVVVAGGMGASVYGVMVA